MTRRSIKVAAAAISVFRAGRSVDAIICIQTTSSHASCRIAGPILFRSKRSVSVSSGRRSLYEKDDIHGRELLLQPDVLLHHSA